MAFAITKTECYGLEVEQAVNKRYRQYMNMTIIRVTTDTDLDIGDHVSGSLGTFWDAVDGDSAIGDGSLTAIRDIVARCDFFNGFGGDFSYAAEGGEVKLDSSASVGGNATETLTVTGLLTTDTILSVDQYVDGDGAATGILSWGTAGAAAANDALSVTWNADPGAGAKVRVTVQRTGDYTVVAGTKAPNLGFTSGEGATTIKISLEWVLKPGHAPVEYYAAA